MSRSKILLALITTILIVGLVACSAKDDQPESATSTSVAQTDQSTQSEQPTATSTTQANQST